MEDKLAFIDQEEEPAIESPAPEVEQDPDATVEQEVEPEVQAEEPAVVVQEAPAPQSVPLPTFLDLRDRLKEAERKAAELEARVVQPEPLEVPDMFENPEGYNEYIARQVDDRLYQQTLAISKRFAVKEYGQEAVDTAVKWAFDRCNTDPYFNAQVRANPDPIGFAVEQHRREQLASEVSLDEYEKFKAWKAAQAQAQHTAPVASQPSAPPRSIASIPSSGGVTHVPTGPGQAFDSVFNR